MTKPCPVCQSAKIRQFNGGQFKKGIQIFKNRVCEGCGTVWQPECPPWVAMFLVIAGLLLGAGWLTIQYFTTSGFDQVNALMSHPPVEPTSGPNWGKYLINGLVVAACLIIARHGIRVLRGTAGKLEVLGNLKAIPTAQQGAGPELSLNDRLKNGSPGDWPDTGKEYLLKRTGEAFVFDANLDELKSGVMAGSIQKDWGVRKRTDADYDWITVGELLQKA